MTRLRAKRPTPALVISILALFVALGGSAYAASKIGTKQIKNNAITAAKIKKNAVTGAKIKNGAITGSKIKLSSLGTVPSATNAGHASSADNATNATNFNRYFTTGIKKVNLNETVVLASAGPFTFYGQCVDQGGGYYEAFTFAKTSQPHSMLGAYENDYSEFDFEPGEEGELGFAVDDTDPYWSYDEYSYYSDWEAVSPDGSVALRGSALNGVHVFGAPCAFNLSWLNNA